MPIQYSFVTRWKTNAPHTDVWEVIKDSLDWPRWWKSFTSVTELSPGDEQNIGSIRRYTLKSPTGYKLTFDLELLERKEYKRLHGKASGELQGSGTWTITEYNGETYIECLWHVQTTKKWMNALAFMLKPAFMYNHQLVMKKGAKYLSAKLGVPVHDVSKE
jgi:uncharacterized membrane protein